MIGPLVICPASLAIDPCALYHVLSAMVIGDTRAGEVDHKSQPSIESYSAGVDGAHMKESRHIAEL